MSLPSPFNYFEKIYCINLAHRQDRWREVFHECDREAIKVERSEGVYHDNPVIGFNQAQRDVFEKAKGLGNVLILEDDCVFKNTVHLHYGFNELPADWDCLYLGANILGIDVIPFRKPIRHSAHLFTLLDAWQTHAVAYSKKGIDFVLKNFKVDNGYAFDEWLRHNMLPRGKSFIIAPQIAYQRAGKSDLWNNEGNYEHLFEQGNKILR